MTKNAVVFLPPTAGLPGLLECHVERLRREAPAWNWNWCRDDEEFARLLPEAELAVVWGFPASLEPLTGNLRLLATPAAGRDWIHIAPRPGLDIVFGTFHGQLMAETVLGMMLSFSRGIVEAFVRRGDVWPRQEVAAVLRPLRGTTAVIVGFGHIGKWIGRLLAGLGVRLIGVNRRDLTVPDYFRPGDRVTPATELDAVLPEADHVVMVLPGGPDSDNVLDERRLGLLPAGAYVYNVGRGNAVDLAALEGALRSGHIAGAGLDVFPEEPLPADAAIRACPGVIRLPHVSAFGPNYFDLFFDELLPRL